MGKFLGTLSVPIIAGDPASPANGDIWYNSSTGKFRKKQNGTVSDLDTTGSSSNAAADGSTIGVATFAAADFNDNGSGLISLDYTNGQAASASNKGYLSSSDWSAFNNKLDNYQSLKAYTALGSVIKAEPIGISFVNLTTTAGLTSGTIFFIAVYLPQAATITGVKWFQGTQGVYTNNNYNGVGLYTYSGGTLTLVASSADDGTIWKAPSGTIGSKAFSSTYAAAAGLYFIGAIYSSSAQTTAPTLRIPASPGTSVVYNGDFTNSGKLSASLASQTALPSSQTSSSLSSVTTQYYLALY